ncbi:spermatogenesis-associated serine-rich protein 2-like [Hemitrygon akajei]|uniref:spermatogenesis-associated serine-rich protein 2-like n=1 Tax=Hemitrygon akajei TaxID=2704970 RepID=UPI003BF96F1C
MAKKQNQKDPTGVVFDTRSKAVMAQGGSNDKIKEKITAVRAIVPNRSNNEIILVLQHYDNCVDKAVQAFMEGYATEVLKEWNVTGKKKNKKKKKIKPKPKVETEPEQLQPEKNAASGGELSAASSEKEEINGYHINGSVNEDGSVDSLSEHLETFSVDAQELDDSESLTPEINGIIESAVENEKCKAESKFQPNQQSHRSRMQQQSNAAKSRSHVSSGSLSSASLPVVMPDDSGFVPPKNKKIGTNIEKSAKDLQRCTVSLARYRTVIKEEMDVSIKKMKVAFAEIQNCFMDREVALLGEMDKVKAAALEILDSRQKRAEALKRLTDNAVRMSEEQLVELRADIKHFVSERKYDEDLGRCAQFTCDVEELKASIQAFGQVSHPKNNYSARSRCGSVSSVSVTNQSGASATTNCSANPTFTKTAKNNQSSGDGSGDGSTAATNYGNQFFPSNRSVPLGNRRSGYRSRENGISGQSHNGRNDNKKWYRNGPRNYSKTHYNPHPTRQSFNTEKTQVDSTAPNGTAMASASRQPSLPPAPANALPQRRPRSSGNEAPANS